jgi:hypothetical protein
MWHYEFTIDGIPTRSAASSYEACLTRLLAARLRSPRLTDPKIFEGGTLEIGSGTQRTGSSTSLV